MKSPPAMDAPGGKHGGLHRDYITDREEMQMRKTIRRRRAIVRAIEFVIYVLAAIGFANALGFICRIAGVG